MRMKTFPQSMTREMTEVIKGVAILLMVTHHCFGFPQWYVGGISYTGTFLGQTLAEWICVPTKICVAIFACLTGYLYEVKHDFSYSYACKKIIRLYFAYWMELFFLFLPLIYLVGNQNGLEGKWWQNIWGYGENNIIYFGWYVYFYLFTMTLLPLVRKLLMRGGKWLRFLLPVLLCGILRRYVPHLGWPQQFLDAADNCLRYFPCVVSGIWIGMYGFPLWWEKFWKRLGMFGGFLLCVVIYLLKKEYPQIGVWNLEMFYAPIFIYGITRIFVRTKGIFTKIFRLLGRYSMQIWFLHAVFFTPLLREETQWIAFLPQIPFLVVIWVILLCLIPAFIFAKLEQFLTQKVLRGVI